MKPQVKNGVWATMITPFTEDNKLDYNAIDALLNWYAENGVDGVFALCYSSEILYLSREEKEALLRFIVKRLPKGMGLVASGHGSNQLDKQIEDFKRLRDAGAPAIILVANRLAEQCENENALLTRVDKILEALKDTYFGVYECPAPYKRFISPEALNELAWTGRFVFMKDTSCDMDMISKKLASVKNTSLKLFNANSATLLQSVRAGAPGFCGIMCNFHPDLYARMLKAHTDGDIARAEAIQCFLGAFSVYEKQYYPVNAKAYLKMLGLPITTKSRMQDDKGLTSAMRLELEQLKFATQTVRDMYA